MKRSLKARGFAFEVKELPSSTRTAQDAAQAVGCTVPQIAKSLIFAGEDTGNPVLAVVSGANRVDTSKLAERVGEAIAMADADYVKDRTGFAIGGVPPVGHAEQIRTFIDENLLGHEEIWAAAGTPNAVFKLPSSKLPALTQGDVADITE